MVATEKACQAGFRRRLRIVPAPGRVTAAVEDDFHCMVVTLGHDGAAITAVEASIERAPWTTCPGAVAVVRTTFTGTRLAEAAGRGRKSANCTHLYDLALLAAAHAGDAHPTVYDVFVSDPVERRSRAEVHRDGVLVFGWELESDILSAPADIAGMRLFDLRGWIASLPAGKQEAARILQWASLIARGRTIPMEAQSDAARMPPNCYTFQPELARKASRIGQVLDFSTGRGEPLDHFEGTGFRNQQRESRVVWP